MAEAILERVDRLEIEKVKTYTTLGDRAKLWNNLQFNIRSSLS